MQGKSIMFVMGGIGLVDGFFPLLLCLAWILHSVYAMSLTPVFTLEKKDCCGRLSANVTFVCVCVFFPFLNMSLKIHS